MSAENVAKIAKQVGAEIPSAIDEALKSALEGDIGKSLRDGVVDAVAQGVPAGQEFGIRQLADHKECGQDNCLMCSVRSDLASIGFKNGVKDGIRLAKKYPELEVD